MATSQYIGARYVPLFADPYDWDDTREYEPLTVVYSNGNSYTSRQYVPKGTPLADENYWVVTGNYNAQVEQYRKETNAVSDKYDTVVKKSNDALSLAKTNERDIAANDAELAGTADSGLKTLITEETERAKLEESSINGKLAGTADSGLKTLITEETERAKREESSIDSKFPIASDSIADGAVTAPKMATSAVSSILQGFTVRRFDNTDAKADNTGMVCPAGGFLSGFYIVELGILVINRFSGTEAQTGETTFSLPTYVPSVSGVIQMADFGAVGWTSTSDFSKWTGLRYGKGRHIFLNTSFAQQFASVCALAYLKPYESSSQSANYANAVASNQII